MTPQEKRLYHQIHPIKLFTDISTAFASTYLFWIHKAAAAVLIATLPSVVVTVALIRNTSLERYRDSSFGRYLKTYMDSRIVDGLRLSGFLIMVVGGWYRHRWVIVLGLLVIIACWARGLFLQGIRRTA